MWSKCPEVPQAAVHRVLDKVLDKVIAADQFQAYNFHTAAVAQPQILRNIMRSFKPLLR